MCYSGRVVTNQATHSGLRDLLSERRLTQSAFARRIGKPEATVNRWIQGVVPQIANQDLVVRELNLAGQALGLAPVVAGDIWVVESA